MDIPTFRAFCHENFPIAELLKTLTDGRKRPRIPVVSIFWSLLYGGVLGLGSLLGIDQFLRTKGGKRLFGTKEPLVSDSTLSRVLAGMNRPVLRNLLQTIYAMGRHMGPSRYALGPDRLRVGMIDGSCFGKLRASCFAQIGSVCLMADIEPFEKQGKELGASERLLERLAKRFGRRFVDLVLLDGLYVAQHFIRSCLDNGVDVLIKTCEEGLLIIQDAMGLLMAPDAASFGVEIEKGLDKKRQRTYEVRALSGFHLDGVDAPFKVAYVRETEIKSGKTHAFFVLTTMQDLSPNQIRELAHWRWDEENNGFKALNHLMHTKHEYAGTPEAQEAMLLILMCAGNLFQLFDANIPDQTLHRLLGKLKRTRRLIQQLLFQSLWMEPAPDI